MKLKCISLWQPHASAVALELKRNETRGRSTKYRGTLGIHAAQKWGIELELLTCDLVVEHPQIAQSFRPFYLDGEVGYRFPHGCLVAVADLVECHPTELIRSELSPVERSLGNYDDGRFAWVFENVRRFPEPVPMRGHQGFFYADVSESAMDSLQQPVNISGSTVAAGAQRIS
jgi:hypothetical protein